MQLNINSNQNFGMAVKLSPNAAEKFPFVEGSKAVKAKKILLNIFEKQKGNENDVFVRTNSKGKIEAVVGQKTYREGTFTSPVKAVKKAAKHADSLQKREVDLTVDKNADYSRYIRTYDEPAESFAVNDAADIVE